MLGIGTYLKSHLAREHLIVVVAGALWIGAAIWQLWAFGGRPEVIITAIIMGGAAGVIGFHLAIVNRIDSDEKDQVKRDRAE